MDIREARKILSGIKDFQNYDCKKLGQGESNFNFLVIKEKNRGVLRVNREDVLSTNRLQNEMIVLKFLEDQEIEFVPRSLFFDKKKKIHIVSFLPGENKKLFNLNRKEIKRYAKNLSIISSLKLRDFNLFCKNNNFPEPELQDDELAFKEYTIKHFELIKKHGNDKNEIDWLGKEISIIKKRQREGQEKIWFSHGDITSNILVSEEEIYFIDWELARFQRSKGDETGIAYSKSKYFFDKTKEAELIKHYAHYSGVTIKKLKERVDGEMRSSMLNHMLWARSRELAIKVRGQSERDKYKTLYKERMRKYKKIYN